MDVAITKKLSPFFSILILFIGISLLNIPVIENLWMHSFDDGTYSHAYLIPFISLYLYYQLSVDGELQYRKKLSIPFTIFLTLSAYLLFVTTNAQISIGYWLSFLLLLLTSVMMLFRFNLKIIFPSAFLVFILPFWGILVPFLQDLSVISVTFIMSFTGIPTFVEAQTINIPAGVFEIAGGCSGLRYLLVSLAISSMFIFLYISNMKKAITFFTVAILGALITNWIRITLLIIIGEYTEMQSSLMEDHNMFGWYLYVPFMFFLFKWGEKLSTPKSSNNIIDVNEKSILEINKVILIIATLIIGLSSTSLKNALKIHLTQIESYQKIITQPKPIIFNYSSVQNKNLESIDKDVIYNIYSFDNNDLDSKATFYGNQIIPEGWQVINQRIEGDWHVFFINKDNKSAILKVSYEIDSENTATPKKFKINRLIKGLISLKNSKLHWQFKLCDTACELSENK